MYGGWRCRVSQFPSEWYLISVSICPSGPGGPERSRFWGSGMDEAKPTAAVNGVKPSLVLSGLSEASSLTHTHTPQNQASS